MSGENWDRIQELFLEVADVRPENRARFLDAACGGDEQLRREVESLLAFDGDDERNITAAVEGAAQSLLGAETMIGRRLGAYRVLREIGHGGMSTVYLATRADDQFRKQVAIKVVKHGMDSADLLDRFRHERQILANFDHPYIARLLDGGGAPDGRPFLVMEHVQGQPIDTYCRERGLDIEQRCRLFLKVCDAVSCAHRNLVVHRDLKPGNIFVTPDGTPKLLDFGVAKLLTPESEGCATPTVMALPALTPEYASPEQIRGLPVNTTTDVYSLGAVLYELLTGQKARHIQSPTLLELERSICGSEPTRPSTAARGNAEWPHSWRKQLAGDLDNIVLMAMRKEPERRYQSVDQLAEDIQRYLDHRPVMARRDSVGYRSWRFARRHRLSLAGAAIVFASLLSGVIIATSQARLADAARRLAESRRQIAENEHGTANRERARAQAEALLARGQERRAEQRLTEMVELANRTLFDVHAAIERLPGATEARRRIVATTLDYLEKLSLEAGQDDQLRLALSAAYYRLGDIQGYPFGPNLGDTTGALKNYQKAAALIEPLLAEKPGDADVRVRWVSIQLRIGVVLEERGKTGAAVRILGDALPVARAAARLKPTAIDAVKQEGLVYEGIAEALSNSDSDRALTYARRHLAAFTSLAAAHPADHDVQNQLSNAHAQVGKILNRQADLAGALHEFRACAAIRESVVNAHPNDVVFLRNLMIGYGHVAAVLGNPFIPNLGDAQGAREYYGKAVAIARQIAKADPRDRTAQWDLASAMLRQGAVDVSTGGLTDSLAALREAGTILIDLSRSDPQSLRYRYNLAVTYEYIGHRLRDLGRPDEAVAEYRRSLEIAEAVLAQKPEDMPSHAQAIAVDQAIAGVLAAGGDRAGALEYSRKALARAESRLGEGPDRELRAVFVPRAYLSLASVNRTLAQGRARAEQQLADWRAARDAAGRAAAEWQRIVAGRQKHPYTADLARVESLLADCDAHLK